MGEDFLVGDQLDAWDAGADVDLANPTDDDLIELDPVNYPGFLIGVRQLAVYDDGGDGLHDSGDDELVAWTGRLPTWLAGDLPPEFLGQGAEPGWNLLQLDFDTGAPEFHDLADGEPLTVLDPDPGITLGGTSDSLAGGSPAVALIPIVLFDGVAVAPLGDGEAAGQLVLHPRQPAA